MTAFNDQYVRGRMAQFLFERGYPVNDIAEDGISEEGYFAFLKDDDGKRIINRIEGTVEREERPWRHPEHWVGLERIMRGDW